MTEILRTVLSPWSASKIPSLAGKVAVLTGGNEVIGAAFTAELLKHRISKVIIASNDTARHQEALSYFNKEAGYDVSSKVIFYEMDLGDYPYVKKPAKDINKETTRIDILDCDAAIGMFRTDIPTSTADKSHAIDRHFACNNVGHAILLQGVLPTINNTANDTEDIRIVVMASNLHFSASKDGHFSSIKELNTDGGPTLQYNRSKLRNVGAVESFNEKIKDTLSGGVAGSAIASSLEAAARTLLTKYSPAGALSALYAATSPEVKENGLSGEYIIPNGTVQEADKRVLNEALQDRYYDLVQEYIQKNYGNAEGGDHQEGSKERGCTIT